jgi:hypothetical protein
MADDTVFNVTAFCESATQPVDSAVCAVNAGALSIVAGLDTFFLIFGVSGNQMFGVA